MTTVPANSVEHQSKQPKRPTETIETDDLRRVTLSDGRAVLVDADDPNDDSTIRAALEADE